MRLKITDINFTNKEEWIFKLIGDDQDEFYIMQERFYKERMLKSPITKRELDYYDKNQWINGTVRKFDEVNVVVEIS